LDAGPLSLGPLSLSKSPRSRSGIIVKWVLKIVVEVCKKNRNPASRRKRTCSTAP
jgi:hypothetical protein